jgi:hypothetical protein
MLFGILIKLRIGRYKSELIAHTVGALCIFHNIERKKNTQIQSCGKIKTQNNNNKHNQLRNTSHVVMCLLNEK